MGLDISEKHAPKPKKRTNEHLVSDVTLNDNENEKIQKIDEDDDDDESSGVWTENDDGIPYEGFHTSYSGVQFVRRRLLEMTISYLEANETPFSESCLKKLRQWVPNPDTLNYERVYKDSTNVEDFRANDILGLVRFVMHSDFDDFLSEGETLDLFRLLEKVRPFKGEENDWFESLFRFTQQCVQGKRGMYFH